MLMSMRLSEGMDIPRYQLLSGTELSTEQVRDLVKFGYGDYLGSENSSNSAGSLRFECGSQRAIGRLTG